MAQPNKCSVGDCDRNALATVSRHDLPGPLRLCATHTEQFRQSSDGWVIDWPRDAVAPSSVSAPGSENLWAYKRPEGTGAASLPNGSAAEPDRGLQALKWPQRALRSIEARRKSRR